MGIRKALAAAVVTVAALAGCGSIGSSSEASGGSAATVAASPSVTLTLHQRCVAVVTGLLLRTEAAVDQGYSGGIDTSSVMEEYGVQSGIWQAFFELDAQELAYFAENGTQAGKPPQLAQVSQTCTDYGA